jgi:3'(2'), 5'-bisphosphate nucleotidase
MFSESQTKKIISFALEAGEIATKFFRGKNFTVAKKPDGTNVTSADIAVSNFLYENLSREFPEIPIICEEQNLREVEGEIFFLIDPIDGTSSFIKGSGEFSINIALIQNKKPVFGLIYAPLFEGGKMFFSNHENKIIDKNGKILQAPYPDKSRLRIVASARAKDDDIKNYVKQIHPDFLETFELEKLSSSVKFFRLLEGKADLYLHLRQSCEWDIAAGHALIKLMNGKVKNLNFNQGKFSIGEELVYKKPDFENKFFIAQLA